MKEPLSLLTSYRSDLESLSKEELSEENPFRNLTVGFWWDFFFSRLMQVMFKSPETHSVGFSFWLELRKSFGILWTVGRWHALPLTPYFPYLYLDLKMAFFYFPGTWFPSCSKICGITTFLRCSWSSCRWGLVVPRGMTFILIHASQGWFFGIEAEHLEGKSAAIPYSCAFPASWMLRKTKCVEITGNPWSWIPDLTSQGFGFISGAPGFPAPFCCWLRSLDGDWELIPLNLMEKPGKKPLTASRTALVLPSRSQINLLNPFMAPAGKRF